MLRWTWAHTLSQELCWGRVRLPLWEETGLIAMQIAEPQRLIRSEVLSDQGDLWSHLCPDPVFQESMVEVAMWKGEQKGAKRSRWGLWGFVGDIFRDELFLNQCFLTEVRTNRSFLMNSCFWLNAGVFMPAGFNLFSGLKHSACDCLGAQGGWFCLSCLAGQMQQKLLKETGAWFVCEGKDVWPGEWMSAKAFSHLHREQQGETGPVSWEVKA